MIDMSLPDPWGLYLERVNRTTTTFKSLNELCVTAFKSNWLIWHNLDSIVRKRGKILPPYRQFISIYFRRNTIYLQSAHILACIGFVDPSANLQRTVYETVLRGYLFIVEPEEANLYHSNLGTSTEEAFLHRRKFYGHSYLREQLFEPATQEKHKRFYKELCIPAHAEIKGLFLNFPEYSKKEIENKLRLVLSLAYGNIQMMVEGFLELLDSQLKDVAKIILKEIVASLGNQVPVFEPDKGMHFSKITLKHGNFEEVL